MFAKLQVKFIMVVSSVGRSALPDMYAWHPRANAYISGKARLTILQLKSSTFGRLISLPVRALSLDTEISVYCCFSQL